MVVQEFLTDHHVPFQCMAHHPTFTAQTLAQALHVTGERVAKTVLLRVDEDHVLAVVPATHTVDLGQVRMALNATTVRVAREAECGECFSDCELGALPPFGSRYGMRTIIHTSLLEGSDLVFEANTHRDAIRMLTDDYVRLERPLTAKISHHI